MPTTRLNTRFLRKVAKHFLEEPLRVDMNHFVALAEDGDISADLCPPCRTTHCIAGAALILKGTDPARLDRMPTHRILRGAARAFGIQLRRGDITYPFAGSIKSLFFLDSWPEPFRTDYREASIRLWFRRNVAQGLVAKATMARATADRIEHFIKHRE